MDILQQIKKPIENELSQYRNVFDSYLVHDNPLLNSALSAVSSRKGKMMRPILTILTAKLLGEVNDNTIYTAATFEFFHTASLLHDDIVDESDERRGQPSINNSYGNKVAVLVGDYILANALINASKTGNTHLVEVVSKAAQELSSGEILQLSNVQNESFSTDVYFDIIYGKTAALFSACTEGGAMSVNASKYNVDNLREIGRLIGMCFQIRDDIFDYYSDASIGKPTGNDMKEGKITLPVIYALNKTNDEAFKKIALRVKSGEVTQDEIDALVNFTKENGGIDYAVKVMNDFADKAKDILSSYPDSDIKSSLVHYIDFVIGRTF
ncbi:MAG: polyprenyl synthetase family protein [Bacteroidaceae bacterium]|nr:polyprenyl synthetase family protein [Bacteroidaceae bacterium]